MIMRRLKSDLNLKNSNVENLLNDLLKKKSCGFLNFCEDTLFLNDHAQLKKRFQF